jgi:hypothetical protein
MKKYKCYSCGLSYSKKEVKNLVDIKICLSCYDNEIYELIADAKKEFSDLKGVENDL